jgi:hypothetical protein
MAHISQAEREQARWTMRLTVAVTLGVLVLGTAVAIGFPDPVEGPTPGRTKLAWYACWAAFAIGLAIIPLVVGLLERRAGRRCGLGWRLVLVCGVALAMAVIGAGVWEWAFPPLHTECFTGYHGSDATGTPFRVCEDGRVNRLLGESRLNDGLVAGALVLLATAGATVRLRSRER